MRHPLRRSLHHHPRHRHPTPQHSNRKTHRTPPQERLRGGLTGTPHQGRGHQRRRPRWRRRPLSHHTHLPPPGRTEEGHPNQGHPRLLHPHRSRRDRPQPLQARPHSHPPLPREGPPRHRPQDPQREQGARPPHPHPPRPRHPRRQLPQHPAGHNHTTGGRPTRHIRRGHPHHRSQQDRLGQRRGQGRYSA